MKMRKKFNKPSSAVRVVLFSLNKPYYILYLEFATASTDIVQCPVSSVQCPMPKDDDYQPLPSLWQSNLKRVTEEDCFCMFSTDYMLIIKLSV